MVNLAMTINKKVQTFSAQRIGQTVGSGECFDLADQALRSAGAKSAEDFGTVTATADYVWGTEVRSPRGAMVGDIIQFRNYSLKIVTKTTIREDTGGGGYEESFETEISTQTRGHHTAIVDSVDASGRFTVLEQNVAKIRRVQRNELFFVSRTEPARVTRQGKITTTVNRKITVQGLAWFYRPQPAAGGGRTP
jgi:hypothetical protein